MEVTQAPPPAFGANTPQPDTEKTTAAISSDFETFLRMLTAQMQNQDPLNPVESQDFATQLATFSTVEQAVLTNDLLTGIATQMNGNAMQQMSSWIGMEALARAPALFDGAPITVRPDFNAEADRADLIVRDAAGDVVQRLPISTDQEVFEWAGTDDRGAPYPTGVYRFEVESFEGETLLETRLATVFTRIDEARTEDGDVLLRLSDGSEVLSTLVSGLRAPNR